MNETIHLFATTDLHGEMAGFQDSSTIRELKEGYPSAVWIDNGDYFCGNALTTYYNTRLPVSPLVEQANQFGYDVMIPGNHDLDHGLSALQQQVRHLNMPYVCANLFTSSGEYIFEPYTIVEKKGKKIAVIGLITQALPQILSYDVSKDFMCMTTAEAMEKVLPLIPVDVDIQVLAYHGGLEADPFTGRPVQYNTGEDQAYQISRQFSELDGIIAGHQHFSVHGDMNGMALIQPGSHGRQVGHIAFSDTRSENTFTTDILEVEKDTMMPVPDFEEWLNEEIDMLDVHAFLCDYFATHMSNACLLFTFSGTTRRGLLGSFPIPYTFGKYIFSAEEWDVLCREEWIQEALLSSSWTKEKEGPVIVYSNDRRLPYYRLQENYIENLFDAYHRKAAQK